MIDYLSNVPQIYIYILLFVFSFTNGLFLFPSSQLVILSSGIMYSIRKINLIPTFLVLIIGNFLGNFVLYLFTKKFGFITTKKILFIPEKKLNLLMKLLEQTSKKYGKLTIFIGRNIPVLHGIVPIFAGLGKTPKSTFSYLSLLGITTWTTIIFTIGFFFGQYYELIIEYLNWFGIIILIFIFLSFFILIEKYFHKKTKNLKMKNK
jgi:membrane-associated protein